MHDSLQDEGGLAIPKSSTQQTSASHLSLMKRSNSSPSLLSSSCDTMDTRDSISDIGIADFGKSGESLETGARLYQRQTSYEGLSAGHTEGLPRVSSPDLHNLRPDHLKLETAHSMNRDIVSKENNGGHQNFSPSPASSECSSTHDEVSELPAIRKTRGHTISIVTTATESKSDQMFSGTRPKVTPVKESGRGGVNPSFVFLQLYHGGMLNHANEKPLLLPQNEVNNVMMCILLCCINITDKLSLVWFRSLDEITVISFFSPRDFDVDCVIFSADN